ncbi:DUF1028 domain-containing protein [Vibrio harveyi]|uniref:DUF1028 domain-containing protein n=1 Tax=Vibrio harveyi TaxID=669 RepID=UPI0002C49295|nr:DUF1028 domain-containing protein [Vibrio harveyi]EMR37727.1 hypothetical protein MUQ_06707 [Vibrio harveyi CAIM 1792]ODM50856.1 hypothetical protein BC455_09935 [Vibrio harveyi]
MTISLIHVNPETGLSASITATGGVAVGGYVNHSWRGVGACATQGLFTNPWYADNAKRWLSQGLSCHEVIDRLKEGDAEFAKRQCMVMDKHGHTAFINGEENIAYVGSLALQDLAVAGNMLESDAVIEAFADSFLAQTVLNAEQVRAGGKPQYRDNYEVTLAEVLIAALEAALEAGGDKRGTYSASLRIESYTHAPIDIRVDWSDDSLMEDMRRVLSRVRAPSFQEFLNGVPSQ